MIVKEILIEKVFIPQSFIDEERESNIENLMDSIEKEGLLEPILVAQKENGYKLIAGYHRLVACRRLLRKTIFATIDDTEFKDDLDEYVSHRMKTIHENRVRNQFTAYQIMKFLKEEKELYYLKNPGARENEEKALKDYEFQQKEIARLTKIYERFRCKPSKAKLAMSRLHQLEKMDILERPNKIEAITFKTNIDNIVMPSREVFILDNLGIGYDKVLYNLNLYVRRGDKIGIIGPNGLGKSTILKTIVGLIPKLHGSITVGNNVNIGYFDQSLAMVDENHTVLEEFMAKFPKVSEYEARCSLGSFLFKGDDVLKKLNVLSGGERVRLQLCKILYTKPNVLILDEPTNHLDIVGREYLETILNEYTGTVLFVSHDRYFVSKVATSILALTKDDYKLYNCSYKEYLDKIKLEKDIDVDNSYKDNDVIYPLIEDYIVK